MSETLTQERLEELADPATCLPSFAELRSLISELQSARSRIAALEGAVTWALGEGDSDFEPPANWRASPYWWRAELRRRSALSPNDALNTRGE